MARTLRYSQALMRVVRRWIKRFDYLETESGDLLLLESGDSFVGETLSA